MLRTYVTAFFVSVLIAAPVLWMLIDRTPPVERIRGTIVPENPTPGSNITIKRVLKVTRHCKAGKNNLLTEIISATGEITLFEATYGADYTEAVGEGVFSRTMRLPLSIDPGPATYRSRACFACNPIQAIWPVCVSGGDIRFNIRGQ